MDTQVLFESIYGLQMSPRWRFNENETAMAVFPGGGGGASSDARIAEAPWPRVTNKVWVAGTRGDPFYSREAILQLLAKDSRVPSALRAQGCSFATPDQMVWVAQQLQEDILVRTLVLNTARYHLPRCVLTFIKKWEHMGDERTLRLRVNATRDPEETHEHPTTSTSVAEEITRIEKYQKKGDVATAEEFYAFLERNKQTLRPVRT